MSALHPKNDQEAKALQEEGVKTQLAQSTDAQERIVHDLKSDGNAKKEDVEKAAQTLDSLKKEQDVSPFLFRNG
ncbi:hypothetical protein MBANPS3_001460 [Mucor bainieri]